MHILKIYSLIIKKSKPILKEFFKEDIRDDKLIMIASATGTIKKYSITFYILLNSIKYIYSFI